jgi:AraC family transcriptional activator of pyochelin receptor
MWMGSALHICGDKSEGLPEHIGCRYELLRLASGLELTAAAIQSEIPSRWPSPSREGISLGVVLEGSVEFGIGRRCDQSYRSLDGFLLASREEVETTHAIAETMAHQIVYVHLPNPAIEDLHRSYPGSEALTRRLGSDPKLQSWKPRRLALILAQQIARCPYTGPLRRLYLEGKALEFLAVIYAGATGDHTWNGPGEAMSGSNRERLIEVRDILVAEFRSPPTLDELARRAGLCTSRLTAGFRRMFQMSITEFVQEQRLNAAFAALAEGTMSVSQVAYSVGYTPAHLSTLFRRKFGIPPSAVRARS